MKITFLGTGASEGIPSIFCNCNLCNEMRKKKIFHTRSQLLINDSILIDFPPDTYYRALTNNIELNKIKAVFITHSHSDHFYGEDFYFKGLWSSFNVENKIMIYGNKKVIKIFKRNKCAVNFKKYNDKPIGILGNNNIYDKGSIYQLIKPYDEIKIDNCKVIALPVNHISTEQSYVYLIKDKDHSILYGTDTELFNDNFYNYFINNQIKLNLIILDGTYGLLKSGEGHMNFKDDVLCRQRFLDFKIANDSTEFYVTHIFHGFANSIDELNASIPTNFNLAKDQMQINL